MKARILGSLRLWTAIITCFGLTQVSTAVAQQTDEASIIKDQRAVKILKKRWKRFLRATNKVLTKHELSNDSIEVYLEEKQKLQNAILGSTDADPSFVAEYFCIDSESDKQSNQ